MARTARQCDNREGSPRSPPAPRYTGEAGKAVVGCTVDSFQGFFKLIGTELAAKIEFVCSDMWQPYLTIIRQHCSRACTSSIGSTLWQT